MHKFISILSLILVFFSSDVYSQKPKTEIVLENKNFKKLVDRSLDFTVSVIGVEDLHQNKNDYILFDAREIEEYEVSHIPGAIHIGYENPDLELLKKVEPGKKVLFYCSIGYRSEKIGEKAEELGVENIYNLYGSIFEWVNKGFELEDEDGNPTHKVHGYNWIWGRWIQNNNYEKVYK